MKPDDLLFAKTHEWVKVERPSDQPATATVGISQFALEALTDLVHIELPKPGRKLRVGETFGEVESVKAVSDLYSPVSGEVLAVHDTLAEHLEKLNADPYGEGWLLKVRLADEAELKNLLDYPAYQKQCAEEDH
ncbi:MAG TPA: glycine cleavage system protein GcvH [Pirellulales bacterium]|nr:glycine cleavage system protein GcvH [Pirellulales bacterium]